MYEPSNNWQTTCERFIIFHFSRSHFYNSIFNPQALHTFASHTSRTSKVCKRENIPFFYYLCNMKSISFIIAVYVLILATVPCYLEDRCQNPSNQTEQSKDNHNEEGCSDCCSPFFGCGTCSGFTFTRLSFSLTAAIIITELNISVYNQNFISEFHSSIWQPPKTS